MDVDERSKENNDYEEMSQESDREQDFDNHTRHIRFYNNYTELYWGSLEGKKQDKSANSRPLIQRTADEEFIRQDRDRWIKVLPINHQCFIVVTIQGSQLQVTLKHLYFNESTYTSSDFERLNQRSALSNSSISKRFQDHSGELVQEVFLQNNDGAESSLTSQECTLFYCDKNLRNVYWLKMSVSEREFKWDKSVININSDYNSACTFTVAYDHINDSNIFMFGSPQIDGVLISNGSKFGRKQVANNVLNLTYISRVTGLFSSIISNKLIKKVRGADISQNYCIKLR